jgi:hypothetical protein
LKKSKEIQELEDSNLSEIGKEPENFNDFDEDLGHNIEWLNSSKAKGRPMDNFEDFDDE